MTKCKSTNSQPEVRTICLNGISIHQLAKKLDLSLSATRKLISSLEEYKADLSEQAEAIRPIAER